MSDKMISVAVWSCIVGFFICAGYGMDSILKEEKAAKATDAAMPHFVIAKNPQEHLVGFKAPPQRLSLEAHKEILEDRIQKLFGKKKYSIHPTEPQKDSGICLLVRLEKSEQYKGKKIALK